jgi:preprotein translocase subunit YajC
VRHVARDNITRCVRGVIPCRRSFIDKEDRLNSQYMMIVWVVLIIAFFYFMAIRPQQKQRRAHQAMMAALKKGDRIGTSSGIYGTVKRVEDNVVVVEIAKGVSMKIARRAVVEILTKDSTEGRAATLEGTSRRGKAAEAEAEDAPEDAADETQVDAAEGDDKAL